MNQLTEEPVADPTAVDPVDGPTEMEQLQSQLDRLDVELLGTVRRRIALARRLGDVRTRAGEPRFVHQHELLMMRRYLALGPAGSDLATLLLRLARATG